MSETTERLDAITTRLDAATPGPWEAYDANDGEWPPRPMWCVANDAFHNPPANDDEPYLAVEVHTGVKEDADFIANAPTDITYLLTLARKQAAALERVEAVAEWIKDNHGDYISREIEDHIRAALGAGDE